MEHPAVIERRMVTVLFADMVDYTATAAAQDPERLRAALAVVFERAAKVIAQHGGTVEKFIGDQIMAVFGVPKGHEDDAERAVRAGLALHELAQELSGSLGLSVRFRIGVNTGEVATGAGEGRDFLVTGQPVNVGARLYPAAEPGGIVVGALTRSLTHSVIQYGDPLVIAGKGTGRIQAWRVLGMLAQEPGVQERGIEGLHAPILGRDDELAALRERLDRAAADGRPHLVTVVGDAGVGKSRLLREFSQRAGAMERTGRSLPYGQAAAYHAVRSVLPADTLDRGNPVSARLRILAGLATATEVLPGLQAEDVEAELQWAFRKYFSEAAVERPLVLIFEDVHWAIPRLLDLIEDLEEHGSGKVLICCLARPELLDMRPGWGTRSSRASVIRLRPLDHATSERLVLELLRVAQLPEGLVTDVVEKSGGNPLYLEEILRGLIAAGYLRRSDERWEAVAGPAPADVPDSLRAIITARLDLLDHGTKGLLQRASVLGRQFPLDGVRALGRGEPLPPDSVREAVRSEFLTAIDETAAASGRAYQFRHALIRDAVYAAIPKQERIRLHELAADWLEARRAAHGDDLTELAAHHLEQAYVLADELGDPDRERLGRAAYAALIARAGQARQTGAAVVTTIALYDQAERIAGTLPIPLAERREDAAYRALVRHVPRYGDLDQTEIFEVVEALWPLGPTPALAVLLARAAQRHRDRERGAVMADEAIAMARGFDDHEALVATIWYALGSVPESQPKRIRELLHEALELARKHDLKQWLPGLLGAVAARAMHEGRLTDQHALAEEAYNHAKAAGGKQQLAIAAMSVAFCQGKVRDAEAMLPYLNEAIEAARAFCVPHVLAGVLWNAAFTESENGFHERARDHAAEAVSLVDPAAMPRVAYLANGNLFLACAALGDVSRAAAVMRELERLHAAEPLAEDEWHRIDMLGMHGVLAEAEGRRDDAEALYREALREIDRAEPLIRGDLAWNWYRSMAEERLADLLIAQGRGSEARELLVSILTYYADPMAWRRRAQLEAKLAVGARTS